MNRIKRPAPPPSAYRPARGVMSLLGLAALGLFALSSAHGDPASLFGAELPAPAGSPLMQSLVEPGRVAPRLTQDQAALAVQQETGGRVLSTVPGYRGGASGYEVRVLVDGKRVRTIFVDGQGNLYGAD